MARQAAALGVEMFVLDDGWFGQRNDDHAGLGDWTVNEKKLPGGIGRLCSDINKMGLQFGLWFEPECVNPDSQLYRAHPDWAIHVPGRETSLGRNQLVLDLTRPEVRDYIVDAVDRILCSANITYVKWDYNRHISDGFSVGLQDQGEFFHRYILGLYEVLRRIFQEKHPGVLLEGCSSGGNRFDLGMLCFAPQIWTSDDTDAAQRLEIQRGMYCFYPPSCISNHVSMCPNAQTLRTTALSTRFNVACFGVLGYELDFAELTPEERRQVARQIEFYKKHRKMLQFGRFSRYFPKRGQRESWQMAGRKTVIAGIYNLRYEAVPPADILKVLDAKKGKIYRLRSVKQSLRIARFGGLIKHVSPVKLRADGCLLRFADRYFAMTDGQEDYTCSGEALRAGISLAMQYSGTGYNPDLRILGDWGSSLYIAEEME
jgi:alpha-galactosidase